MTTTTLTNNDEKNGAGLAAWERLHLLGHVGAPLGDSAACSRAPRTRVSSSDGRNRERGNELRRDTFLPPVHL